MGVVEGAYKDDWDDTAHGLRPICYEHFDGFIAYSTINSLSYHLYLDVSDFELQIWRCWRPEDLGVEIEFRFQSSVDIHPTMYMCRSQP
jgi:hypothetical protein